jgi:hypothetical protein
MEGARKCVLKWIQKPTSSAYSMVGFCFPREEQAGYSNSAAAAGQSLKRRQYFNSLAEVIGYG